jgi:hypothetical protein
MGFTAAMIATAAAATVGNTVYQAHASNKDKKRANAQALEAARRNVSVGAKTAAVAREERAAETDAMNAASDRRRRMSASNATVSGLSVLGGLTSGGKKTLG